MEKEFYINDIKLLEWFNFHHHQKIVFKNRTEYRFNGKLHNPKDAAVEYNDPAKEKEYWLEGIKYEYKKWKTKTRKYKTRQLLENEKPTD